MQMETLWKLFPGGSNGRVFFQTPAWKRSPEEEKWIPTPILPREFHGKRSLAGSSFPSPWGRKESDTTEQLSLTQNTLITTYHRVLCFSLLFHLLLHNVCLHFLFIIFHCFTHSILILHDNMLIQIFAAIFSTITLLYSCLIDALFHHFFVNTNTFSQMSNN